MKLYIRQPSASTNQRKPTKNIDMGKQTNAHAFTSKPIHQSNGEQRATYSPATNTRPKQAKHPNTADAPPRTNTNANTNTPKQTRRRQHTDKTDDDNEKKRGRGETATLQRTLISRLTCQCWCRPKQLKPNRGQRHKRPDHD